MPWIGGGLKPMTNAVAEARVQRARSAGARSPRVHCGIGALRPVLQRDESDAGVGLRAPRQEIEAGEGDDVLHGRVLHAAPPSPAGDDRLGAVERGGRRQDRHQEDVALVLVGNAGCRARAGTATAVTAEHRQRPSTSDDRPRAAARSRRPAMKPAVSRVEAAVEDAERRRRLACAGLEQQRRTAPASASARRGRRSPPRPRW